MFVFHRFSARAVTIPALVALACAASSCPTVALAMDTTPPSATLIDPDGGEAWLGGSIQPVRWSATDNVGVTRVDLHYRTSRDANWIPIARYLSNNPAVFSWYVNQTPDADAWVRVTAFDAAGNAASDTNDVSFRILPRLGGAVASTLRDFEMPGTPVFGVEEVNGSSSCTACHAGYDEGAEPGHAWKGTMMAHAARDPLFIASLIIAEQDVPGSGDFCLRCHAPGAWIAGRCSATDGTLLTQLDKESVSCEICHAMVDPNYVEGESPEPDLYILESLPAAPTEYANGQYVLDPEPRRRGPYEDAMPAHDWLPSPFFRTSEFCGTCHDVSNPLFERVGPADYALGELDAPAASQSSAHLLPLERTYSEWKASQFAIGDGVFAPEFAGNKPDGYVSTCQDCHMADVAGMGAIIGPHREDLGFHDLMGGSVWMPNVLASLYPNQIDVEAARDASDRAEIMLSLAALLDLEVTTTDSSRIAEVTVTNRTGHKLPTGFPEGRRMWIHVVAKNGAGHVIYESGAYNTLTGVLTEDADIRIYEGKMGISESLATELGRAAGPTFHFALNDTFYKDNRIPPLGYTNAGFEAFGGQPVDPDWSGPEPRYPDGQNWDRATYEVPVEATTIIASLQYQSVSKEHVEFLHAENRTNAAGNIMLNAWAMNGRAAPFRMVADTVNLEPVALDDPGLLGAEGTGVLALFPETNPFRGAVDLRLDLPRPVEASWSIHDASGRQLRMEPLGALAAGPHHLRWDGRDSHGRDVGAGVFWVRVRAGRGDLTRQIVKLE